METNITGISKIVFAENTLDLIAVFCPEQGLDEIVLPKNAPKFQVLNCYSNNLTSLALPDVVADKFEVRAQKNNISQVSIPETIKDRLYLLWLFENNLSELTLPTELPAIRYLYLRDNHLSSLTVPAAMPELEHYWVENNDFRFSTLPTAKSAEKLDVYKYAPQNTMRIDEVDGNVIDLSSEYAIVRDDGVTKNTVYKWYAVADGNKAEFPTDQYTAADGLFTFTSPIGTRQLRCEMTNELYPELTLVCEINSPTTGVDNIDALKLEIYPNPATDHINISLDNTAGSAQIRIFDLAGHQLIGHTASTAETTISLSDLASGIYIISIETDSKAYSRKIMV